VLVQVRSLGATDLKIAPLVLGGNVFGWTTDRETSFAILDAFLDAGFNAIDTADVYNRYAPGLRGGESESILGEWMKRRGVRERIVLITKGGLEMGEGMQGLGRAYLMQACEASLQRLQTDYIDVYMTHRADPAVPVAETLETLQALMDQGKVRYAGSSNYTSDELNAALAASGEGRARYEIFEPHYNLADRGRYEGDTEGLCSNHGLGVIAYYSLAAGFLTGKYRCQEDLQGSSRRNVVSQYLHPRGLKLLEVLDVVAMRHEATPAQVALAWLMARPSVTAPIASATSTIQLSELLGSTEVALEPADIAQLDLVSR
jgi:aryl-alcohol dehydrogenase-like predicted oxidoreductase